MAQQNYPTNENLGDLSKRATERQEGKNKTKQEGEINSASEVLGNKNTTNKTNTTTTTTTTPMGLPTLPNNYNRGMPAHTTTNTQPIGTGIPNMPQGGIMTQQQQPGQQVQPGQQNLFYFDPSFFQQSARRGIKKNRAQSITMTKNNTKICKMIFNTEPRQIKYMNDGETIDMGALKLVMYFTSKQSLIITSNIRLSKRVMNRIIEHLFQHGKKLKARKPCIIFNGVQQSQVKKKYVLAPGNGVLRDPPPTYNLDNVNQYMPRNRQRNDELLDPRPAQRVCVREYFEKPKTLKQANEMLQHLFATYDQLFQQPDINSLTIHKLIYENMKDYLLPVSVQQAVTQQQQLPPLPPQPNRGGTATAPESAAAAAVGMERVTSEGAASAVTGQT